MVNELLALFFSVPCLTPMVSAEAAYTLNTTQSVVVRECCGLCNNGIVTHGDGHVTECACPDDCKCKAKTVKHPQATLHPCPDGKCKLKPSK